MHCTRKVTDSIDWVGGTDRRLALFENLFPIPNGISYHSYLIRDKATALIDTVDLSISRQFFENISYLLENRTLDYLIINHMEPDHCACLEELLRRYPSMKIVGNLKTLLLIKQFYGMDLQGKTITASENGTLSLGAHTLRFYMTPMVHWPEVMVTFEESEKVLFSADAFGSFGALNGKLFQDEVEVDREFMAEFRRYYGNIVGKYGPQVQMALKKLSQLDIHIICPLHGLIWRGDLSVPLNKYCCWSRYEPEESAVLIVYGSMYGNTENAVNILTGMLAENGVKNIAVFDVSSTHVSTLIAEVFRASHSVLASPTYNNGIYPAMQNFLHDMKALNLQKRTVALIENGSWSPASAKQMRSLLEEMKEMKILDPVVTIPSSPDHRTMSMLNELKENILASLTLK